uniref:50S ribosomal protein L21 n=1 Tax=Microzonia abyssicola TaxID=217214 RepID=UPI002E78DAB6|nr:50S ribosomal protein L21 [Syringoderma abyssicola]WAM64987.1 50S ribosomal protein L21 [Syringoderma abyssicola]
MEYAIIEASGRQFWVEPKKFIELNRLILNIGSTIVMKRILFVKKTIFVGEPYFSDALIRHVRKTTTLVGQPYLTDILVKGIISKHFLGPKIIVFKMKPKKKYRKKIGHRQKLTRLLINQIDAE